MCKFIFQGIQSSHIPKLPQVYDKTNFYPKSPGTVPQNIIIQTLLKKNHVTLFTEPSIIENQEVHPITLQISIPEVYKRPVHKR